MSNMKLNKDGWEKVELQKIAKIRSGGTPKRSEAGNFGGEFQWAKIGDIEKAVNRTVRKTSETITQRGLNSIGNRLFPKGTLLFAMYGSVGKTAFAGCAMSSNQAILGIEVKAELNPHFLNYWFVSNKTKLLDSARGVALKNLNARIIRKTKILLPPLPVQKQIADLLDTADALRQKTKDQLAALDELAQATFLDMFGDPVTNEKGWEVGVIGDAINEAKYGTSAKASAKGKFPYLRMNNLTYTGHMDFSDLKYIDIDQKEEKKYLVQYGDILFNRTNSKELVGKTAVYKREDQMAFAGYLIRLRPNSRANSDYISAYLNSSWAKQTLKSMCNNIVGMANINAKKMQNIKLLIPPIQLQNQFANIIKNIEAQKARLKASLQESEDLFNSLLQDIFS